MSPERYVEIRALAVRLIASCAGGETEDHDIIADMTPSECKVLDGLAFECCDCNQWWNRYECADDDAAKWVCVDCGAL